MVLISQNRDNACKSLSYYSSILLNDIISKKEYGREEQFVSSKSLLNNCMSGLVNLLPLLLCNGLSLTGIHIDM